MDDLKPYERFLRLPDNPEEQQAVLERARKLDPEARLHLCGPPTGPILEVHNVQAMMWAKIAIADLKPAKFQLDK